MRSEARYSLFAIRCFRRKAVLDGAYCRRGPIIDAVGERARRQKGARFLMEKTMKRLSLIALLAVGLALPAAAQNTSDGESTGPGSARHIQ